MPVPMTEFDYQVRRLGTVTKSLADDQSRIYFDELKDLDEQYFIKAISFLVRHHKYRSFPSIADILATYRKEIKSDPHPNAEDLQDNLICDLCGGTGWIVKDEFDPLCKNNKSIARYCSCSRGMRLHNNHEEYYRKKNLLKYARIEDGVWEG